VQQEGTGTLPIRQIGASSGVVVGVASASAARAFCFTNHQQPWKREGHSHYLARKWPASRVFIFL